VLIALYASMLALARAGYRAVLFPAPRGTHVPVPDGASLVRFAARDGVTAHALLLPAPAPDAPTLVQFHGNGETIADNVPLAEALRARGVGVLLVEYRGYGVSQGAPPSEVGLYLDAEAALDELARRGVGPERVVLWGTSLGTGVAAEMASRGRGARLVLVTPYTSIPELAARYAPLLPAAAIIVDRFDTLAKAPRLALPALVIHGDRDEVVPYDMGRAVAAALPSARLVTVPGGHHNDLFAKDGPRLLDAIAAHALAR
jgi:hypothetical protein